MMKSGTVWLNLGLVVACAQFARSADSARVEKIHAILSGLQSQNAPGAAVLVLKNGQAEFSRGYGITDLRTHTKIDSNTNFRLASLTKQFTAMAVMLLVQDGKLRYEDRLTDIFPDFPEYGRTITVRNLLNHTSGLEDYEDLMAEPDPPANLSQINDAGVLQLLRQRKSTKFIPGTKWAYSNSGYVVLGLVVRKISGMPFGDFLQKRIFGPLEMNHTVAYEKGKNEVAHRAYEHTKVASVWRETDQSPTSATLGDGGVYSSLDDLSKWDAALRRHTLLNEAQMKPAVTPVEPTGGAVEGPDGQPAEYGFGWFLNPYKGHSRMWHYGETVGFRTAIQRFVDENLTIVVLSNRADMEATDLALRIAELYLTGKPAKP